MNISLILGNTTLVDITCSSLYFMVHITIFLPEACVADLLIIGLLTKAALMNKFNATKVVDKNTTRKLTILKHLNIRRKKPHMPNIYFTIVTYKFGLPQSNTLVFNSKTLTKH